MEPNGKDAGINVRKKVETIMNLVNDTDKIKAVREKANANRDKYNTLHPYLIDILILITSQFYLNRINTHTQLHNFLFILCIIISSRQKTTYTNNQPCTFTSVNN